MEKAAATQKTESKEPHSPDDREVSSKETTEKKNDDSGTSGVTDASSPIAQPQKSTTPAKAAAPSAMEKSEKPHPTAIPATRQPIAQTASLASELTADAKKKVIISRQYAGAALVSSTATVGHPIISTKPNGSMQASKAIIAEATAAAAANPTPPSVMVPPIPPTRPVPMRQPAKQPAPKSGAPATPSSVTKKKQHASTVEKMSLAKTLPKSTAKHLSSHLSTAGKKRKAPAPAPGSSTGTPSISSATNAKVSRLQQQAGVKSSAAAAPVSPSAKPLADPEIVQLVENILTLLQLYGPLNRGQLEFNLPPLKSSNKNLLADVLRLLVTIGVIKTTRNVKNKAGQQQPPPLYCIFGGLPRSDFLMPQTIWSEIELAQEQGKASLERCGRLRLILEETTNQKKHPREALTRLLAEYPEIRDDPVFVAGLRNLQVDMASLKQKK